MCCCKTHCMCMHEGTHILFTHTPHTHTHTDIQPGGGCLLFPAPYPPPVPLSHKCILLLISWLHICLLVVVFFFSINKALIAFSLECDLAHCVLSLWGADLEGPVWTITLQLSPRAVIKHKPSAKCHAPVTPLQNTKKTLQDKGWHKVPHKHTHRLHGTMAEENNVYFKCRRKRKDVKLEGNQAGKLKSKDKYALWPHHKHGNYGVFQNRGQAA